MSPDEAADLIRAAIILPTAHNTREPDLVKWDDLRHGREPVDPTVLAAARLLADRDPRVLLSALALGAPSAVATIATFLLSHNAEATAQSWFEHAPGGSIRELALAAWLRATATTWRRAPDVERLSMIANAVDRHDDYTSTDIWWRILCLSPRLDHLARDAFFLEALYHSAAQRIGRNSIIPSDADLIRYRQSNAEVTAALIYASPLMKPTDRQNSEESFWRHLRGDILRNLPLGLTTTCDQLYLDATAQAIHRDPSRWSAIVHEAIMGALWKPTVMPSREDNGAWLLAAACLAALEHNRSTAQVPVALLDEIWSVADAHLTTLFWDPISLDVRRFLTGVLTEALAIDPETARSRVSLLIDEVPSLDFLDAIARKLPPSTHASLMPHIAHRRAEREPFERALSASPDSDE